MTANTYGRQVVIPLTNKSGGQVIAGDVVVLDSTNNDAFTTSTAGAVTIPIGIAQETIASNASGRVLTEGYAALVNVNASVTRGDYGKTHTVAKQAADAGASRVAGTFCWFLTGGTTPDAWVYPVDLAGAALTNPMTTAGDIIVGGASGAPARLAAGAAGVPLVGGGAGVASAYSEPLAHGCRAKRASGNFSVGNNTYTAVQFNAEDFDTDNIHNTSSNTTRMTIPTLTGVTTGLWSIKASGYSDQATGRTDCKFTVNGSTDIAFVLQGMVSSAGGSFLITADYVFTAADYVEIFVRTTIGAGNVVYDASGSPIFEIAFLGKVT